MSKLENLYQNMQQNLVEIEHDSSMNQSIISEKYDDLLKEMVNGKSEKLQIERRWQEAEDRYQDLKQ